MEPSKLFVCCLFANILTAFAKGGGHGGGHSGGHGGGHSGGHGGGHGSSHGNSGHAVGHSTGFHYTTARHAYYSYHPPARVYYMCHQCSARQAFPVYHGLPPTYVFTYRESGNRYGDLLTGLSLYNLGRTSERISNGHPHYTYTAQANERCSLQIIDRRQFEETKIPCFMVSSFMANASQLQGPDSQAFDISNAHIEVKSFVNNTDSPLVVTNTQECVLWHNISMQQERHTVPCALLKEYSKSISYSGIPVYIWLPLLLCTVVAIYICCRCFEKKKKNSTKEDCPLNAARVVAYRANNDNE